MESRLKKSAERKTKRQLLFSLVGIVVVLFILFKFGIPALTNISLFLSSKNATQSPNSSSPAILTAPVLNQPFSATNSATITVSGTTTSNATVELYVNDNLVDTQTAHDDGSFSFSNVTLSQQQNSIKAKSKLGNTLSDFSGTWNVAYLQKAPNLSIDSPSDGQTFPHDQNTVVVKGKTDPNDQVTVNNLWAIVSQDGSFSYSLPLQNGDNHITVVATDAAGNTTTKQITVHYSQ